MRIPEITMTQGTIEVERNMTQLRAIERSARRSNREAVKELSDTDNSFVKTLLRREIKQNAEVLQDVAQAKRRLSQSE